MSYKIVCSNLERSEEAAPACLCGRPLATMTARDFRGTSGTGGPKPTNL